MGRVATHRATMQCIAEVRPSRQAVLVLRAVHTMYDPKHTKTIAKTIRTTCPGRRFEEGTGKAICSSQSGMTLTLLAHKIYRIKYYIYYAVGRTLNGISALWTLSDGDTRLSTWLALRLSPPPLSGAGTGSRNNAECV